MLTMFNPEDIVNVSVNSETGYKRITVYLKDGREFTVENDEVEKADSLSEGEMNIIQHALLYKTTDKRNSPEAQKQYEDLLKKLQQ